MKILVEGHTRLRGLPKIFVSDDLRLEIIFLLSIAFKVTKACFKRRATGVLSWLDCSSTAARH